MWSGGKAFFMSTQLAQRIKMLSPSPILRLNGKVKELVASGQKVVNLTIGEPDFDTPEPIKQAGIQAINDNFTHYQPPAGIPELRKVVAEKFTTENKIETSFEAVTIGVGSRQLLYCAFLACCDPGDEVLVPTPAWSSYFEEIKLAGAVPVPVPLKPPFKLKAKDLAAKVTAKTKMILINTPSNPTGAMIDPAELKKIAQLAVEKDLWVVADEIYERILYTGQHLSIASLNEEIKQRTITVNGLTKAYAMTGWRVGYATGPQPVINAMISLQGETTSNACSIAQRASLAGFNNPETERAVVQATAEFAQRREFLLTAFKEIPELIVTEPEGAFYLFVSLEKVLNKTYPTAADWSVGLLEHAKVAVVPGEAFLAPGYFRISFASSLETLRQGVEGIKNFVRSQRKEKA
jgi:aspartate aminotransferase